MREATGNLVVIAFYYLLRVGEYTTKARQKKRTRTRQFRALDVTFFVFVGRLLMPLPWDASDKEILSADAATLRISNQKNGHAGECVHHERIKEGPFACPVRALGRRYVHIRAHNRRRKSMLCAFWDKVGKGHITDTQVRFTVKMAAKALKYPERGIPLNRVDTHLLRPGGACALKLSGHDAVKI